MSAKPITAGSRSVAEPSLDPLAVECPACGDHILIPLTAHMTLDDGGQTLHVESDTADLWAPAWTPSIGAGGHGE